MCDRLKDGPFKVDMIALIPQVRAFARALCGKRELADDLAQETLAKAWRARGSFTVGTNMRAWLFMILRNEFYSYRRRAWRQAHWDQEEAEALPGAEHEQEWSAALSEAARALYQLPDEQREALLLVGAGGLSYEEAAQISGTPIGTVKSRVSRARRMLQAILDGQLPLDRTQYAPADATDIAAQLHAATARLSIRDAATPHAITS